MEKVLSFYIPRRVELTTSKATVPCACSASRFHMWLLLNKLNHQGVLGISTNYYSSPCNTPSTPLYHVKLLFVETAVIMTEV